LPATAKETAVFDNVLVGVDGRANGRDAIALAARLRAPDATLTLAHVRSGSLNPVHAVTPGVLDEELAASRQLLEQDRADADAQAQLVSVVANTPGAGLHRQAEEQGADLLVVGTASRGALGRVLIGDDTRAALNGAPCAVAIAARGYAEQAKPIATVGVAYNASPESERALATAKQLAAAAGATVRALEVVTIPSYTFSGPAAYSIGDTINALVTEADTRMKALPGVEGRAVYGLAGEELATFGDELDVLVVGSRGYGPIKRLVVGSTCDYLQRNARCSLLVLVRGGHDDS
jgi:nucleotide-binding universal stress UspA family protein